MTWAPTCSRDGADDDGCVDDAAHGDAEAVRRARDARETHRASRTRRRRTTRGGMTSEVAATIDVAGDSADVDAIDDARASSDVEDAGAAEGGQGEGKSEDAISRDRERTVFVGGVAYDATEEALKDYFNTNHGVVESVKLIYDRHTLVGKGYGFVKFVEASDAKALMELQKVTIDGKAVDVKEATRDEPQGAGGRGGALARERGTKHASGKPVAVPGVGAMIGDAASRFAKRNAERARGKSTELSRSPNYVGSFDSNASVDGSDSGGAAPNYSGTGKENTVFAGGLPLDCTPELLGWFFSHYGTVLNVKLIYDKQTGACKGYGFIVFADVAAAMHVKSHRQLSFMDKMIDVSDAMRDVRKNDVDRSFYGYGHGRPGYGPFYPPQMMGMYAPHHMQAPHGAYMPMQQPMMMMPHMMYAPPGSYAPYDPMAVAAMASGAQNAGGEETQMSQQTVRVDE